MYRWTTRHPPLWLGGLALGIVGGLIVWIVTVPFTPSATDVPPPTVTQVHGPLTRPACGLGLGVRSMAGQAGWGPSRQMFTEANPAPYPTIDSISDNGPYGDEVTFLDAKPLADDRSGGFCKVTQVHRDGELIVVRAYVENDAAGNLGGPNGVGTAKGIRLRLWESGRGSSLVTIWAEITGSNIQPKAIWDATQLSAPWQFHVDAADQPLTQYSDTHPKGTGVAQSAWTEGALLGDHGTLDPARGQGAVIVAGILRVTR
jgi:hypothetical protein